VQALRGSSTPNFLPHEHAIGIVDLEFAIPKAFAHDRASGAGRGDIIEDGFRHFCTLCSPQAISLNLTVRLNGP
jgi:hypothetical protein